MKTYCIFWRDISGHGYSNFVRASSVLEAEYKFRMRKDTTFDINFDEITAVIEVKRRSPT